MDRIEKLKRDIYTFEELDTLEKNAIKLRDSETMALIERSRISKQAKGDKRKVVEVETKRARRDKRR